MRRPPEEFEPINLWFFGAVMLSLVIVLGFLIWS